MGEDEVLAFPKKFSTLDVKSIGLEKAGQFVFCDHKRNMCLSLEKTLLPEGPGTPPKVSRELAGEEVGIGVAEPQGDFADAQRRLL